MQTAQASRLLISWRAPYATIYITVGTGSDGAGNITTVSGSPLSSGVGGPQSPGGLGQSDLSADKNRVSLALFCTGGSYGNGYWCIERSHDNTGADTADYIWFAWATQVQGGGALWRSKCYIPGIGWSPTTWYECFAGIMSISNGGTFNLITPCSPVFPMAGFAAIRRSKC